MKIIFLLFSFASCITNVDAQQAISTAAVANTVLKKGMREVDLGTYQGSLLLQGLAELSVANNDKKQQAQGMAYYQQFGTKQIEGKGSFISYSAGGNGAAWLAYLGADTALQAQVAQGAQRMYQQQKRSSEGLLVPGWVADSLNPVFIDMAFAVTPYMLYAGLKENNPQYIDLAVHETLELFKILGDKQSGLLHQGRGFNGRNAISQDNWSRGNGWGSLAVATLVRDLPADHPKRSEVEAVAKTFFSAVLRHQNAAGLWHQEMTDTTSFTETSGSGLLLYGLGIILQKGLLGETYKPALVKGLNALPAYVAEDGGVSHTCFSCLCPRKGTKADYANHVWVYNDPHSFGPVVLALAQAQKMGITQLQPTQQRGSLAVPDTLTPVTKTYVRYVPERSEDIAWENDRIAFRYYGPPVRSKVGSGIDIFAKSVPYSIIDKWYRLNARGLDYHVDRGEGCDFYHAGPLRGCGGTAIWVGGKPYPSTTYASHRILKNTNNEIQFELSFEPWQAGGTTVWETKKLTMVNGTNFFKVESTIHSSGTAEIIAAIGITTFGQPSLQKKPEAGRLASWEKTDTAHGSLGTAIVANPGQITGNASSGGDEYLLVKVMPNQPFTYFVGAAWDGNPRFKTPGSWQKELNVSATWAALNKWYAGSKQ